MKSLGVLLVAVLMCASLQAWAQADAQKSFDTIKTLAGTWEGQAKMDPPMEGTDHASMRVSMRVTSRGNALVHEMQEAGATDDPTKNDHPVTMFYIDNGKLTLTHYCDAGNRPRMAAKSSADGKTLDFDFIDVAGNLDYGHMQHATITVVDANHHSEDWTFLMPGDKLMHAHMDLTRSK